MSSEPDGKSSEVALSVREIRKREVCTADTVTYRQRRRVEMFPRVGCLYMRT